PNAPTDLVLDASTAEDLGAAIGDEIRFTVDSVPVETGDDDTPIYRGPSHSSVTLTVVGLAEMGEDPALPGANRALTTASGYQQYYAQQGEFIAIPIALDEDATAAEVRERLQSVIVSPDLHGSLDALTVDDAVDVKTVRLSGGTSVITALLLGFAGISVL